MQKITVIYGPPRSGKTSLAKIIAKAYKTVWINSRGACNYAENPFLFDRVDSSTELIIFDAIKEKDILNFMYLLMPDEIYINKRFEKPYMMAKPKIILTVDVEEYNFPEGASFTRRFEYIKLQTNEDFWRELDKITKI